MEANYGLQSQPLFRAGTVGWCITMENIKKEWLQKISRLKTDYLKCDNRAEEEHIRQKILHFLEEIRLSYKVDGKKGETKLASIYERITKVNDYSKFYNYTLAENLREQVTIVVDSIRASPMHQKQLELRNTALIQYQDKMGSV